MIGAEPWLSTMPEPHGQQEFRFPSQHPPLRSVQGSEFFRLWARTVLRFRWPLLLATLAVTVGTGIRAYRDLRADTSDEHFLAESSEAVGALRAMRAEFGHDALFQVLVAGDVFTGAYLRRLRSLHADLEAIDFELADPDFGQRDGQASMGADGDATVIDPGSFEFGQGDDWAGEAGGSVVDQVVSLVNVRRTHMRGDALHVEGLLETWPDKADLPELRAWVLSNPTLIGQVVDRVGDHSVLVVRARELSPTDGGTLNRILNEIAARHRAPGFEVMVAGAPAVSTTMQDLLLQDTRLSLVLSSIVILLITFLLFRHPLGMLAPPLVVWQAEIWTLGTMAITDTPLTMVTTILPAFIGCVGLGDAIHVLSVYRNSRSEGVSNDEAIVEAVATTGMPVFMTTLTTAVGLLSFRLASLSAIQEMGTFGALGVCGALVNSVVFLPIMLTFNRRSLLGLRPDGTGQVTMDRLLLWFDRLSTATRDLRDGTLSHARRNRVLWVAGILAGLAAAGVVRLRVHHDGLEWIPQDEPVRIAVQTLEQSVGGTANLAIVLQAHRGQTLRDRETMLALERLERHILAYNGTEAGQRAGGDVVRNVTSVLDPIRETWRAVHDNDRRHYAVPDSQRGVLDMFLLFENASPEELSQLTTVDMQRALMTVRVKWSDALSYLPLQAHLESGISKYLHGTVDAQVTGSVNMSVGVVTSLLRDLLRSFGTAALVITIFMVFVLRDVRLGLLAMLPNLLPILIVMGFMGYAGIRLDTATLMLGSLAIGIVVDDTIHFLHQFKVYLDEHGDVDGAVRHAFMHTGRAMIATSAILTLGFSTVLVCQLESSRLFGGLVALTVVAALACDFTFLPALLRLVCRSRRVEATPVVLDRAA